MKVKTLGRQSHLQLKKGTHQASAWKIVGTNGTFTFYHFCQMKYTCSRKMLGAPHKIMALVRWLTFRNARGGHQASSGCGCQACWKPRTQSFWDHCPPCCISVSQACWDQMHEGCCKCSTKWAPRICARCPAYSLSDTLSRWGPSSPYRFTAVFTSCFLMSLLQIYTSTVKKDFKN